MVLNMVRIQVLALHLHVVRHTGVHHLHKPVGILGTGTLCAVLIDVVRITNYGLSDLGMLEGMWNVVLWGIAAAFVGSYLGRRLMKKVTMEAIHGLVGVLLVLLGAAIASGIV